MRLFLKIPKKPLVSATSCIFKNVFKRVFLDLGGFFFHLILDCFFSCIEFILPKKKIYSIYFYLLLCYIYLYFYTFIPYLHSIFIFIPGNTLLNVIHRFPNTLNHLKTPLHTFHPRRGVSQFYSN